MVYFLAFLFYYKYNINIQQSVFFIMIWKNCVDELLKVIRIEIKFASVFNKL